VQSLRGSNSKQGRSNLRACGLLRRTDRPAPEDQAAVRRSTNRREARDDHVVVTRNGRPAVVILSYDEYERLRETLDVLADPAMMRQVHRSLEYFGKGGKGRTFETVFGEPLILSRHRPRASA